ncbi:C1 family peptidase [bacterium]|nr:C1 family peptidase [Verrucomicrobiota bacterium]MDA7633471.1 C1 family peptidase [bacterium]
MPVFNINESTNPDADWTIEHAFEAGVVSRATTVPVRKDLRAKWWKIYHQEYTGACVGFSSAYGVLWWHYVKERMVPSDKPRHRPSARFIWMASKETDEDTKFPTTFLDQGGGRIKQALNIVRKFGCVFDSEIPMKIERFPRVKVEAFYLKAGDLKIKSYVNLGRNPDHWKRWLALQGPIVTRLVPDDQFMSATRRTQIGNYRFPGLRRGGHAVCLAGYDQNRFLVRNSFGTKWGEKGYLWVSREYAETAMTEAYGVVV